MITKEKKERTVTCTVVLPNLINRRAGVRGAADDGRFLMIKSDEGPKVPQQITTSL